MKGRSKRQLLQYEGQLDVLVAVLTSPMSVREILDVLAKKKKNAAAATVYARLDVLVGRGEVVSTKRRKKIAGKSGQRERVYSIAEKAARA